jgi:L-xylulokinase
MRSRILAIDAGSSSIKGVLFDETGKSLSEAGSPVPLIKKPHGIVERDLQRVWEAVLDILSRIKEKVRKGFDRIDVVCVTGAGDGLILLDDFGKLVRPAITSLDTRANGLVASFKKSSAAKDLYNIIGEIPYPATALALLKWIRLNERACYDKARMIVFLKDWVRYKLTSEVCTDITDASATLTDLNGSYRKEIFDAFDVPESVNKTVEVKLSHEIAGHITRHVSGLTGLKTGVPVVCGLHDCSASSLGTGRTRPGDTCLIIGSWCGNQIVTDRPILNRKHADRQLLRSYAIPNHWLIISASPTSLVNINWFANTFMQSAVDYSKDASPLYAIIDKLVDRTRSDESLIFHPYLYGSQTSEEASAGFYGIRPWHTFGHFLKSIYEGIAINYSIHVDNLEKCLPIKNAAACGGGTRSEILLQIIADALNRKVSLYSSYETTALGAAITAAVGIGIYRSFEEACKAMTSIRAFIYPKKKSASLMRQKRNTFIALYKQMNPIWKKIHA